MSRECWIPVDLHEDLAPLVEEWGRRAQEAADAKARRDAFSPEAENRDRRNALTEARGRRRAGRGRATGAADARAAARLAREG